MARQRMVSPGFFTDEEMAAVSPLARLLFIGLWTIADKRGRLEDRPIRIKVMVLPYDESDVDGLLQELVAGLFIQRYEVEGRRLIQIRTFEKHQHTHVKEPDSKLPAPPPKLSTGLAPGEHRASTGRAPDMPGSGPSESESESESVTESESVAERLVFPRVVENVQALATNVTAATSQALPRRRAR